MFYRQKFLGGVLQVFGGQLPKLEFQKYLLLSVDCQDKPLYDFTPYKYGNFSFASYADQRNLLKKGIIEDNDNKWIKKDTIDYLKQLTEEDKNILLGIKNSYGKFSKSELIKLVYKKYPYYTIKSEIIENYFTAREIKNLRKTVTMNKEKAIYSIGYEGKSIDNFINLLIKNNINILVDVRKNPLSMKYGFSKKQLSILLNNFRICYINFPQLGISSNKRRKLNSIDDYLKLFKEYEKTTLFENSYYIRKINELFKQYGNLCLMCFEADPKMCHRTRILKALANLNNKTKEL